MSNYRIELCKKCANRSFHSSQGIVCGLTNAKPTFELTCSDFEKDVKEEQRLAQQERAALEEVGYDYQDSQESSTPVWKTILGIIIFIVAIIRLVAAFAR